MVSESAWPAPPLSAMPGPRAELSLKLEAVFSPGKERKRGREEERKRGREEERKKGREEERKRGREEERRRGEIKEGES